MVFRPERNAAFEWTAFDVHAAVGKPGKCALVEVVVKALGDGVDWDLKLRRQPEEGWSAVYSYSPTG